MLITDLPSKAKRLPKAKKDLFNRFFWIDMNTGTLNPPKNMVPWLKKQFPHSDVKKQKIVRAINLPLMEAALFNELRTLRPLETKPTDIKEEIKKSKGGPFCNPLKSTPADSFGRVKGTYSTTCSNVAKYEGLHGVTIFKDHDPWNLSEAKVHDYLTTALKWTEKAKKTDKTALYPLVMWNCLWRASASLVHGHMQMVVSKKRHVPAAEIYERTAEIYATNNGSDFYEDWFEAHKAVNLDLSKKIHSFVNLTPKKDKEVVIISHNFNKAVSKAVYATVQGYKKMGVESFNMLMLVPSPKKEIPYIIRLVNRGKLSQRTTDFGAMEIYANASVIETDPYKVRKVLKTYFDKAKL